MIEQDRIEELTDSLNKYVKVNIELIKLEATDITSMIGSKLIANLFILLVGIFILLFFSIAVGFYLSSYFDSSYLGFLLVAAFYFLLLCVLVFGKKKLIEKPLRDKIICKIFNQ
jgi:hypothetical protein